MRRVAPGDAPRHEQLDQQGQQHRQPHRAGPLDQGQPRPGVLEHHRLVDHRQLEMGLGLSTGRRPVSATMTMHERHRREGPAGVATLPDGARPLATMAARLEECDRDREREDGHEDGRLDQRRDRRLPAGAHAAERRAGVQPGERQRDGAEEQQAHDGEEVTGRVQRRPVVTTGTIAAMSSVLAATRIGAAVKMIVVPSGRIRCLRSSFAGRAMAARRRRRRGPRAGRGPGASARRRSARRRQRATSCSAAPLRAADGERAHRATTSTTSRPIAP